MSYACKNYMKSYDLTTQVKNVRGDNRIYMI